LAEFCKKHQNIVLKNVVPHKNMTQHYNNADIFVFPSLHEGSALVTYEAMSCGLPVITTRNSGSIVRDGLDGFIVPLRDASMLAEKMQYFYDNQDKIAQMGKSAGEHAKDFTWDKYGHKLIGIYNKISKTDE
jgi:glycosyltransferase involved in cell wall biosynthesis